MRIVFFFFFFGKTQITQKYIIKNQISNFERVRVVWAMRIIDYIFSLENSKEVYKVSNLERTKNIIVNVMSDDQILLEMYETHRHRFSQDPLHINIQNQASPRTPPPIPSLPQPSLLKQAHRFPGPFLFWRSQLCTKTLRPDPKPRPIYL